MRFETKRLIVRTVLYGMVALIFVLILYIFAQESTYYTVYPDNMTVPWDGVIR